jgi:release factor glutamine methyltransferase
MASFAVHAVPVGKRAVAVLPTLPQSCEEWKCVYEPSDDTFLLCDALEQDRAYLHASRPQVALEVGSGSGCVITFLAKLLQDDGGLQTQCLATDINPAAVQATMATARANGVAVDVIRTGLVDGLLEGLISRGGVDVLLFNPPYVPTPDEEVGGSGIEASWAGGEDGRVVIDKFLPLLPRILSPTGRCYLVLVQDNKPAQITKLLSARYNLKSDIVLRRQAFNESLQIMMITRLAGRTAP